MLVKNWMSTDLISVDAEGSIQDAAKLIKSSNLSLLPVIERGYLVGVVTEKDMKRAIGAEASSLDIHELLFLIASFKIRDIMTKNPISIPYDATIEEAAQIMLDNKISAAPVVDEKGTLKGIIKEHDIFRVMVSLTGVRNKGIQFAFQLEDRPLSIKEVTDIIRRYGCRIVSIMSTIHEDTGYRHVYIRACDCGRHRLDDMKEELTSKVNLLYMVDHGEKKKELYKEYSRPPAEWFLG